METLAIRSDLDFKFSGFRRIQVKGHAGFAAGKPRVCSVCVYIYIHWNNGL